MKSLIQKGVVKKYPKREKVARGKLIESRFWLFSKNDWFRHFRRVRQCYSKSWQRNNQFEAETKEKRAWTSQPFAQVDFSSSFNFDSFARFRKGFLLSWSVIRGCAGQWTVFGDKIFAAQIKDFLMELISAKLARSLLLKNTGSLRRGEELWEK